jgi:WD40 repeat protein
MDDPTVTNPSEEEYAALLEAWDEALAAGRPPPADTPPDLRDRLERDLAFLRLLGPTRREVPTTTETSATAATQVPGYEVLGELGRGGMGVVYKARQESLPRLVALKMVLAGPHAGPDELARFRLEAELLARLQHPNIVQIYEVGTHDGRPFFALEFVEGGTLADRLRGEPLPPREAATLTETLALAVHVAHEKGIVHRDLKPSNILLAADGTPKITDFGLARQLDVSVGQTATGAVVGTPCYMAPEQAEGHAHRAGPAADVWALGAILYECLTGRPPFQAPTVIETLLLVRSTEPTAPRALRRGVPRDLETICLKCLQKEPHRRYPSAQELAEDLRRFREGRPIVARPAGVGERVLKWARRRPAAALAGGLLILVVVLGSLGGAAAWLWRQTEAALAGEKEARTEAEAQKQRAEEAKEKEEEARKAADEAKEEEKKAKDEEKKAKEALARVAYLHQVDLAHRSWTDNDIRRCRALLAECPTELRQWEWHYLNRLCDDCLYTVTTPQSTRAVFSPDGKVLVTFFGGAIAWDARTGAKVAELKPSNTSRRSLTFSPDGKRFADPLMTGGINLCDAQTGEVKLSLDTGGRETPSVAFSSDGQRLTGFFGDGTAGVWDARTGRKEKELNLKCPPDIYFNTAVSPDGKLAALGGSREGAFLRDLVTGEPTVPLQGDKGYVDGLTFSPDGKLLAASVNGTVRVWEVRTGLLTRTFPQGRFRAYQVAFSPDGKRLSFGGRNGMVCVCDVETGKETLLLRGVAGALTVAFSPDGTRLAAGGWGEVKVWDAHAEQAYRTFRNGEGHSEGNRVALSADGKRLASYVMFSTRIDRPDKREVVKVWDVESARELRTLEAGWLGFALRPDGREVALSGPGYPRFPRLWGVDTGREGPALQRRRQAHHMTYSADGKRLACNSAGRAGMCLQVWEVETGRELFSLPETPFVGRVVALSPDGKQLALTRHEKEHVAEVWDVDTSRLLRTLPAGIAMQGALLTFTADGLRLIGVGITSVQVWDVATGREVRSLQGIGNGVFSPDGRRMARGVNAEVQIWDVETGRYVVSLARQTDGSDVGLVSGVAFSADGRLLVAGYRDGTVSVWDGTPRAAAPAK